MGKWTPDNGGTVFGLFGGFAFAAVLAMLSLPGWVFGLFSGKIIAAVVGAIVYPLMDAVKRGSAWLDARNATVKRIVVVALGIAVAWGLQFIGASVAGCTTADPTAAACNVFSWDATTWTGVLGALFAMLLKLFDHAKQAAAARAAAGPSGNVVAPGLGSPQAEAAYRAAHTPAGR